MSYATLELRASARPEQPDPILRNREVTPNSRPASASVRSPMTKQTNAGTTHVRQPLITNEEPVTAIVSALDGGPNDAEFGFHACEREGRPPGRSRRTLTDLLSEYDRRGGRRHRYF